jgi:hypothetical protein
MMAAFSVSAVEVEVANILVLGGVPEEKSGEVVFVEFGSTVSCSFDAYPCAKEFQALEIWFGSPPSFEQSDASVGVDPTVMEV